MYAIMFLSLLLCRGDRSAHTYSVYIKGVCNPNVNYSRCSSSGRHVSTTCDFLYAQKMIDYFILSSAFSVGPIDTRGVDATWGSRKVILPLLLVLLFLLLPLLLLLPIVLTITIITVARVGAHIAVRRAIHFSSY